MLGRLMRRGRRHPLVIMAILQSHYERMLRLDGSGSHDQRSAASLLKVAPFQAQKALEPVPRLGRDGVARAIELLAERRSRPAGAEGLAARAGDGGPGGPPVDG